MRRYLSLSLVLAAFFVATAARAESTVLAKADAPVPETPATNAASEQEIDIVLGGIPTRGSIVLPATDTNFKFRLKDVGTVVDFKWTALEDFERKRVQKLYGMDVSDGKVGTGKKITGVRVKLTNNKSIEGLWIPDRDRPGYKALRTEKVPLMLIVQAEIVSEEPIERNESDFFSALELYTQRMLEKPPGPNDAGAHLEMARWCAGLPLYDKAIEHLEQAKIIDPRTEERNQDFRQELVQKYTDLQAQTMFNLMTQAYRGQKFLDALDYLQQMDRTFKNSALKSRWDALRNDIEAASKTEINKKIVEMSYRVANDLIQSAVFNKIRIDDKGNKVPSKPGKLVTTKQGSLFRGILIGYGGMTVDNSQQPDEYEVKEGIVKAAPAAPAAPKPGSSADDVTLKLNDTTITIAGKDILLIQDIDLAEGKGWAEPTYDDLKDWVYDLNSGDGLKMQMCRKIGKVVKMPADDVKKIFDNRLNKEGKYADGKLDMTNNYANNHDAYWDAGSWLRPGSKPVPYQKKTNGTSSRNGRNGIGGTGVPDANGRYHNAAGQYTANNQPNYANNPNDPNNLNGQQTETSVETDDPMIWWKDQGKDLKIKILRAMAAEKVFKAVVVNSVACPTCGGRGHEPNSMQGDADTPQRCSTCRGISVLYKLIYH